MKKAFSLIAYPVPVRRLCWLTAAPAAGTEKRVVNVCSWGEYIDESLIQQFEEATGIEVNYQTSAQQRGALLLSHSGRHQLRCDRPLGLYDLPAHRGGHAASLWTTTRSPTFPKSPTGSRTCPMTRRISIRSPTPGAPWASSTTAPWWTSPSPAGTPCLTPSMPTRS